MKIKDILGGKKTRTSRDNRKHRKVQRDSLYTVDAGDLGEAFGRAAFTQQLKKHGIDADKMHSDNVKDAKAAKKRSKDADKDLADYRKKTGVNSDLKESKGRDINHVEDLVIFYGKQGGQRAVNALRSLETSPQDTTIKWDGSPAVVFGRDDAGEFILTDKSGFGAKGYDGKVKSPSDLQKMFLNRKLKDPSKKEERKAFAKKMAGIWPAFESATPADFRGFIAGDLMYTSTPGLKDGRLAFQPNTTMYSVDPDSDIGGKISQSKVGVVVHVQMDSDGNKSKPDTTNFQAGDLLILPPVTISSNQDTKDFAGPLQKLEQMVGSAGSSIDSLINPPDELKMKDFQNLLYAYINSTVKSGETPGAGFVEWLKNAKVSDIKKQRVAQWVSDNKDGFNSLWQLVNGISTVKDKMIAMLDSQPAEIEAYTDGQRGGEGYVVGKDVKLVNRAGFTKANATRER